MHMDLSPPSWIVLENIHSLDNLEKENWIKKAYINFKFTIKNTRIYTKFSLTLNYYKLDI